MGLGGLSAVSLATARELAAECRRTLALGGDPIGDRKRERERKHQEESARKTFGEFADEFIKTHEPEWSNAAVGARLERQDFGGIVRATT